MQVQKGYYSLLQFCPDPSRLEAVNLGIVLYCPDSRYLSARTAKSNLRAAKLVGRENLDRGSLNSAKRAIERRLDVDKSAFENLDDFQRFVETRANALKLTAPRPLKVFDPEQTLDDLFRELVGGAPRRRSEKPVAKELDDVFRQLEQKGLAQRDIEITVPVVGRRIRVPYAYRNGMYNLIKTHPFSHLEGQAMSTAMRLAIEGDLIQKHGIDSRPARLIVVPSFEHAEPPGALERRVQDVLSEYQVTTIGSGQLGKFCAQVIAEAH